MLRYLAIEKMQLSLLLLLSSVLLVAVLQLSDVDAFSAEAGGEPQAQTATDIFEKFKQRQAALRQPGGLVIPKKPLGKRELVKKKWLKSIKQRAAKKGQEGDLESEGRRLEEASPAANPPATPTARQGEMRKFNKGSNKLTGGVVKGPQNQVLGGTIAGISSSSSFKQIGKPLAPNKNPKIANAEGQAIQLLRFKQRSSMIEKINNLMKSENVTDFKFNGNTTAQKIFKTAIKNANMTADATSALAKQLSVENPSKVANKQPKRPQVISLSAPNQRVDNRGAKNLFQTAAGLEQLKVNRIGSIAGNNRKSEPPNPYPSSGMKPSKPKAPKSF